MGDLFTFKSKPIRPGINLAKWKSTYAIAAVLLVRLKQVRLLNRLVRKLDIQIAQRDKIISIQQEMIEVFKRDMDRISKTFKT